MHESPVIMGKLTEFMASFEPHMSRDKFKNMTAYDMLEMIDKYLRGLKVYQLQQIRADLDKKEAEK